MKEKGERVVKQGARQYTSGNKAPICFDVVLQLFVKRVA